MINKGKVVDFVQSGDFYFKLGTRFLKRNKVLQAKECFEKAVNAQPEICDYYLHLARSFSIMGNVDRAIKTLKDAISKFGAECSECYFDLACNYFDLADFNNAKSVFEEYCRIDPNALHIKEAIDAVNFIEKEVVESRNIQVTKAMRLSNKAKELLDKDEFDRAIDLFKQALVIDDTLIMAQNNLSLAYYYTDRIGEAIDTARGVLKVDKTNTYANTNLALFYRTIASNSMYNKQLNSILKLEYKDIGEIFNTIDMLDSIEEHEIIKIFIEKQVRVNDSIVLWHFLAIANYNIANFSKAIELWEVIKAKLPHMAIFVDCFIIKAQRYTDNVWNFTALEYDRRVFMDYVIKTENLVEALVNVDQDEFNSVWYSNCHTRDIINYFLYKLSNDKKCKLIDRLAKVDDQDAVNILSLYVSKAKLRDEVSAKCSHAIMQRKVAGDISANVVDLETFISRRI